MVWENPEVSMWENGDDLFYHSNMFILCMYRFGSRQKCSWTERIWKNLCMYSYVFSVGQFFLMYTFVPVSINVSIHSNIIRQSLWLFHLLWFSFITTLVGIYNNDYAIYDTVTVACQSLTVYIIMYFSFFMKCYRSISIVIQ